MRRESCCHAMLVVVLVACHASQAAASDPSSRDPATGVLRLALRPRQSHRCSLGDWRAGETIRLLVSLETSPIPPDVRVQIELSAPGQTPIRKTLHPGDTDFFAVVRWPEDRSPWITLTRGDDPGPEPVSVCMDHRILPLAQADRAVIEAEPNDTWQQANPLRLGRDVYGSADDVDYLANPLEGKTGLDWFRFKVDGPGPVLVYFQLDLLDRDLAANLRVYTVDARTGQPEPYIAGKDPMEIVHDRERERYSKHICRTFRTGTYFLEVNADHPDYVLRTRVLPIPPYDNPEQAVEAGMQYIMSAGDAWFAQVPREGNIFVRADNIHDTATRCTACHAASFSTEANLAAHRFGYPIRSKASLQYVMDRIANSVTPLYGTEDLCWQRFIAVPLQAQGEQGAILAEFEREVSGRESPTLERFGPFLKVSWANRRDLPQDEQNNVVPVDSKFGFAWRDWQVLSELARRTGRADYVAAAANVASILGDRAADKRIETLQDRIHRLHAWWLIDRARFANKIRRETGALLAFQNPDGGWHETDDQPGPSAVYTTGQLTDVLLEVGLPRDHPAIARAIRYLLSQQQEFGGWFQPTTHENFRTPMRETRYAVMALARAFPRHGAPLISWGNRDDGPARLPRTDSLVNLLDDLENLWDVPAADRSRFAGEIIKRLADPEPLVRAAAAACLGRLGRPESAEPLAKLLGDPSKIVWRSAAWALRRLGNEGIGLDTISRALRSADPRVRRGAVRIFAYQFQGMDGRLDLADRLIELTRDPDLWTRLQALRSLRQWFYRTRDPRFQRTIIETYLARMAEPDVPVVRKNLSEGLYIMLDENLGGGVSLQKNIAELPESLRQVILEGRRAVERDVLLTPALTALERGNSLQRSGVLKAFDGSFFRGRVYARQPEAMLDVGNDREFGFLFDPPLDVLERSFTSLFSGDLPAEARRHAIQISSFFKVPERTASSAIQTHLLGALADPDSGVRESARRVVERELAFASHEGDPRLIATIRLLLADPRSIESRPAVVAAIGRNSRLRDRPDIKAAVRGLLTLPDAAAVLLPLLGGAEFSDAERLDVVDRGWNRLTQPQRATALDLLFAHPELLDRAEPPTRAVEFLLRAADDPAPSVRERTLAGLRDLPSFRSGKAAVPLLLRSLANDSPETRKLGLALAASKASFWERADAIEYLARLLVDPDAAVRSEALDLVKHHGLVAKHPPLARRVKALIEDPALTSRAEAAIRAAGLDPDEVAADVSLTTPRLPSLETFKRTVNPIFYQPGNDTYACARCHATHTILRIAEADPSRGFTEDQIKINYTSALRVANLGQPESSLILRKPRSPEGQRGVDPSSPGRLTHVGGPRWEGTHSPEYQAILAWIREASPQARPAEGAAGKIHQGK